MAAQKLIQEACNSIISGVRHSSLNYAINETPFSIYITVRKSESKIKAKENISKELYVKSEKACEVIDINRYKMLEDAFNKLQRDYKEAVDDAEAKHKQNIQLIRLVENKDEKIIKLEANLMIQIEENQNLLDEKLKVVSIKKKLNDNLKKAEVELKAVEIVTVENKKLKVGMQILEKENLQLKKYRDKVNEELSLATEELEQSKDTNIQLENQLDLLVNVKVESTSCQTEQNLDIPYKVTSPLPPIFSSELCYTSRKIFLSNSMPNLTKMSWCQPSENFTDEAEEALAEQDDRIIREFYEDERERVRAERAARLEDQELDGRDLKELT
jgi:hypothetical protein